MLRFSLIILIVTALSVDASAQVKEQLIGEGANAVGNVMQNAQLVTEQTMRIPAKSVPYLGIFGGASHAYGEFGRLKACLGGISGLELLGGVGKEYIFNSDWKDRMTWHAGAGFYFTDGVISGDGDDTTNILSIDMMAARTPLCEDLALMFQLEWDYWFGYDSAVRGSG